jgi:hypothetical protein
LSTSQPQPPAGKREDAVLRGYHISTTCASREEFLAAFTPYVHGITVFIPGLVNIRVGEKVRLRLSLRDGTNAFRALVEAHTIHSEPNGPMNKSGVVFVLSRLDEPDRLLHQELLRRHRALLAAERTPALTPGPLGLTPMPIPTGPLPQSGNGADNPFAEMSTKAIDFLVEAKLTEGEAALAASTLGTAATLAVALPVVKPAGAIPPQQPAALAPAPKSASTPAPAPARAALTPTPPPGAGITPPPPPPNAGLTPPPRPLAPAVTPSPARAIIPAPEAPAIAAPPAAGAPVTSALPAASAISVPPPAPASAASAAPVGSPAPVPARERPATPSPPSVFTSAAPRPVVPRTTARPVAATAERSSMRTRRALGRVGAGATLGACGLLGYLMFAGGDRPPTPGRHPAPAPAVAPAAALALAAPPPATTPAGETVPGGTPAAPPAPAAPSCTATIESTPRASAFLGGKALGRTPLRETPVPCGASELVLSHPRYRKLSQPLNASPDAPATVSARLERPSAQLQLRSKPTGATIKVNGRDVGRAPLKLDLARFETVNVQATLPGRKPWKRKVFLKSPVTKLEAAITPKRTRR